MKTKDSSIVKFHKQFQMNIGIIICVIILIYVLFHLFTFFTSKKISVYEVRQGSIASNNDYNALALRSEQIVSSDQSGYLYYFDQSGSRVGAKSTVYALDSTGSIVSSLNGKDAGKLSLSDSAFRVMQNDITTFIKGYSESNFRQVYSFQRGINDKLNQSYNEQAISQMADAINAAIAANTFHQYSAPACGLLSYTTDGYEKVTIDNFTSEDFDSTKVKEVNLRTKDKINAGTPVYKIITADTWNLVVPIDASFKEKIKDRNYIQIKFNEDEATSWGKCSFTKKAGQNYLILTLDDSMDRYADYRFLNIELMMDEESGLKIPNSAITKKTFYKIPKDYFFTGGSDNALGVMVKSNDKTTQFVEPTIYYETENDYYVDNIDLAKDNLLLKPNSTSLWKVGQKTGKLQGVYNVNKGYAVFKQIEVLYKNEDYSIIKEGTDYGISLYDHIALQGSLVQENEIIN